MAEDTSSRSASQMILGAVLVGLAAACAAVLLLIFKDLLQGHFDKLPFLENFRAIVSKSDSFVVHVQGAEQKIKIPDSVFFISALSMFIFAASIVARLLRAFLQSGIELINGGPRKQFEKMMAEIKKQQRIS